MPGLTVGKFAAVEGVGVETVRFYHRRGLLALPERQGSGYREYSEADRWRLAFIRRARRLGFTLGEVRDLHGPAEARSTDEIVRAAEAKLWRRRHPPTQEPGAGRRACPRPCGGPYVGQPTL